MRLSSPRRWGCFYKPLAEKYLAAVFPTQVGVFLVVDVSSDRHAGLPHAGGGVSLCRGTVLSSTTSSPRRWGCFCTRNEAKFLKRVFPTQVGVFLTSLCRMVTQRSLPHAGGGVSFTFELEHDARMSSPRRWGCFQSREILASSDRVFPTQVGVFLKPPQCDDYSASLPHAGGGVSDWAADVTKGDASSPRRWGCFSLDLHQENDRQVFPTQVGVFPRELHRIPLTKSLPHAGGGVSNRVLKTTFQNASSPRRWGCF